MKRYRYHTDELRNVIKVYDTITSGVFEMSDMEMQEVMQYLDIRKYYDNYMFAKNELKEGRSVIQREEVKSYTDVIESLPFSSILKIKGSGVVGKLIVPYTVNKCIELENIKVKEILPDTETELVIHGKEDGNSCITLNQSTLDAVSRLYADEFVKTYITELNANKPIRIKNTIQISDLYVVPKVLDFMNIANITSTNVDTIHLDADSITNFDVFFEGVLKGSLPLEDRASIFTRKVVLYKTLVDTIKKLGYSYYTCKLDNTIDMLSHARWVFGMSLGRGAYTALGLKRNDIHIFKKGKKAIYLYIDDVKSVIKKKIIGVYSSI